MGLSEPPAEIVPLAQRQTWGVLLGSGPQMAVHPHCLLQRPGHTGPPAGGGIERFQGTPPTPHRPTLTRSSAAGGENLRIATRPVVSWGKPQKIQLGMAKPTIPSTLGVAQEHLGCQYLDQHKTPLAASSCGQQLSVSVAPGRAGSAVGPVEGTIRARARGGYRGRKFLLVPAAHSQHDAETWFLGSKKVPI